MAYIYVASSWRNRFHSGIVASIRARGHEVYDFMNPPERKGFSWREIDEEWKEWSVPEYKKALESKAARLGFYSDMKALTRADLVVLVLPSGRSSHLELGWAKGQGKKTAILLQEDQEAELMYKMADYLAETEADLLNWIGNLRRWHTPRL